MRQLYSLRLSGIVAKMVAKMVAKLEITEKSFQLEASLVGSTELFQAARYRSFHCCWNS